MIKIDMKNKGHQKFIEPYYYSWYRADETVKLIFDLGYEATTKEISAMYFIFNRQGVPRYNRNRIFVNAVKELDSLRELINIK